MTILTGKILSLFMALLAYSSISIGFVFQKMGIHWIGWKGPKTVTYYKSIALWITGFIIMNTYGVPSAIALKDLSPHIVASFSGWGIVLLILLSHFLLKEPLYKTDLFFSFIVIIGIILLNGFEQTARQSHVSIPGLIFLCTIPIVLFFTKIIVRLSLKMKTVIFASISGISAALMVVELRLLVMYYQYAIVKYFNSPHFYLYIGFALMSFIALQIACRSGSMMIVGPVQYSATIIYPVFASLLVFQNSLNLVQYLSLATVVVGVAIMLKKR